MWEIAGAAISAIGFLSYRFLFRDKIRYDVKSDYRYDLIEDWGTTCRIDDNKRLVCESPIPENHTLIWAVRVKASVTGALFDPHVRCSCGDFEVAHYFECGAGGVRYLDLTGLASAFIAGEPVRVDMRYCHLESIRLQGYRQLPLEQMRIMIVAPHPDDAELAAYGLYERHAERTAIVTISPGERIIRLKHQYILGLDDELKTATRRKGLIRSWDAHAVPRWAGIAPDDTIMLGYFNGTLNRMHEYPGDTIEHPIDPQLKPGDFRCFNTVRLASDQSATNRWASLVADIKALIELKRPHVVVTTHPEIDVHSDHRATTLAVEEAVASSAYRVQYMMYYANHIRGTREYPFGPEHCAMGLPPLFEALTQRQRPLSIPLDREAQRRKVCALAFMHDLVNPIRPFKHIKQRLRHSLRWRVARHYGTDTYFRTAVRSNELLFYRRLEDEANEPAGRSG